MAPPTGILDPEVLEYNRLKKMREGAVSFKDASVEQEFNQLDPQFQQIILNSPKPVRITSGARTPETNSAVGGVDNSYHTKKMAVDVDIGTDPANLEYYKTNKLNPITESDHHHIQPGSGYGMPTVDPEVEEYNRLKQMRAGSGFDSSTPEKTQTPAVDPSTWVGKSQLRPDLQKVADARYAERNKGVLDDYPIASNILQKGAESGVFGPLGQIGSALNSKEGGAFLQQVAKTGTFGQLPKGVAVLDTLGLGEGPQPNSTDTADLYSKNVAIEKAIEERRAQESPKAALAGDVAAIAAPSGGYGATSKLVGKAFPNMAFKAAGEGAGVISKAGNVIKQIPRLAGRGALENVAYDEAGNILNPDEPQKDLGESAKWGAIGNTVIPVAGGLIKGTGNVALNAAKRLGSPDRLEKFVEKTPVLKQLNELFNPLTREEAEKQAGQTFENEKALWQGKKQALQEGNEARRIAYKDEQEAAGQAIPQLKKTDNVTAGKRLGEVAEEENKKLNEAYAAAVDPIGKKYGMRKLSMEDLRKKATEILDDNLMLDKKGNVVESGIESITSPSRRALLKEAANIVKDLKANPTYKKANLVVQNLQSLAKYKDIVGTQEQQAIKDLARTAKESMIDSLGKHATPEEVAQLTSARRMYAEQKPVINEFRNTQKLNPEAVVSSAGSKFPGSVLESSLKVKPEMAGATKDVVLNNILDRASSPKAMTKAINDFGRENLKSLLSKEEYAALEAAEKRFYNAKRPLRLDKFKEQSPKLKEVEPGKFFKDLSAKINPDNYPNVKKVYRSLKKVGNATGLSNLPNRGLRRVKDLGSINIQSERRP